MSVTVEVGLLSGRTAALQVALDEEVDELTSRIQTVFGVGKGRPLDSSGHVLDARLQIKQTKVRTGESLTLHINQIQLQGSRDPDAGAFAAILGDGSVVTWGHAVWGGDSSAVQDELKNVQQTQASSGAFAAILGDGSVLAWGDANFGGDNSAVQDQLTNVQQIQASNGVFAAILGDRSVVTWGSFLFGGDSSAVKDQLKNVQQIQATRLAFAAILGD